MANPFAKELEHHGIVVLRDLLTRDQLDGMQRAFASRLRRLRWNDFDGYEMAEPYRHMVQDVLTLDQGFVDLALHPLVKEVLREYLGEHFALVEAKGWKSLPTRRDFHGWHGDCWYDPARVEGIPREVKLAVYLTDVRTGAFQYIRGMHRRQAPRLFRAAELADVPADQVLEVVGPAGTAFLFDTSGVHRQSVPVLEPRHAVFYTYHDPRVPLQPEDVASYRYHPLLLNAAFLGGLTDEDRRLLGFGDKTNYIPAYERPPAHSLFQALLRAGYDAKLRGGVFGRRVLRQLRRLVRRGPDEHGHR